MMELIKRLKDDATAKGLCRLWQGKLKPGLSTHALIRLYISGLDFCVCEDFPTLDFLREYFKGVSEPYGVYIDDDIAELVNRPDTVLNGSCKAFLEYSGYSVCRVFARHTSKASVCVSDHAIVTIDAFDNTDIVVSTAGVNSQVTVNLYGKACVECIGSGITVRKYNKRTY